MKVDELVVTFVGYCLIAFSVYVVILAECR